MSDERRRSERKPHFEVVRYVIENREYVDLSMNLSTKGIFIKTAHPPDVGTAVTMMVKLPGAADDEPLKIHGVVRWVDRDVNFHKRGMGIEFLSVVADSLPAISYFVQEVYGHPGLQRKKLEQKKSQAEEEPDAWEYDLDIEVEEPTEES
jgi:uncharacterized protein (TIGR02266 family)